MPNLKIKKLRKVGGYNSGSQNLNIKDIENDKASKKEYKFSGTKKLRSMMQYAYCSQKPRKNPTILKTDFKCLHYKHYKQLM